MAQLTPTTILPSPARFGNYGVQGYRVTPSGTGAATDYFETGFGKVKAVLGYATLGNTVSSGVTFELNSNGTGPAEDSTPGNLGVEAGVASELIIWVIGR